MKKLKDIPPAALECCNVPDEATSEKCRLSVRLDEEGRHPIACGRALITIERCEDDDLIPDEVKGWAPLRLSVYADPDVRPGREAVYLYIVGGSIGISAVYLQDPNARRDQRLCRLEPKQVGGKEKTQS